MVRAELDAWFWLMNYALNVDALQRLMQVIYAAVQQPVLQQGQSSRMQGCFCLTHRRTLFTMCVQLLLLL